MTRRLGLLLTVALLVALGAWRLMHVPAVVMSPAAQTEPLPVPEPTPPPAAVTERKPEGAVWALTFVRARPGQRERMERYLKANWLAVDEQAKAQGHLLGYQLLRADRDLKETWDFVVILQYRDAAAMAAFVPAYLQLVRGRARVRIEGLDFGDLGEVVQQKLITPVDIRDVGHAVVSP